MAKPDNNSLKRKVRNSYIISTISIALVLFLLGSVSYLILSAMKASDALRQKVALHVMLSEGLSNADRDSIGVRLNALEGVREVAFVSKKQAADSFREYIGNDFEEFLQFNPLPDSYEVRLTAKESEQDNIKELDKQISSWKGVDEVVYQKNIVESIGSNINKFKIILLLFGGGLLFISLILLNNTIRLTIYSKRYLINTMKMVGASKWFIIRPFVSRSLLHGIYAWIIAAIMFAGLVMAIGEELPEVTILTENTTVYIILGGMLVLGIFISVLFTTFAVNKFVRMNSTKIQLY